MKEQLPKKSEGCFSFSLERKRELPKLRMIGVQIPPEIMIFPSFTLTKSKLLFQRLRRR